MISALKIIQDDIICTSMTLYLKSWREKLACHCVNLKVVTFFLALSK